MGREGWFYILAFVLILGAGAFLILPRVTGLRSDVDESSPRETTAAPEAAAPVEEIASHAWVEIVVRGVNGPLSGPLKPVVGADVEARPDGAPGRLCLRATDDVVHIGASGHVWSALDPDTLSDGAEVVLEDAAPALILRVREADGRPAAGVPVLLEPRQPGPTLRTGRGGAVVVDAARPGVLLAQVGGRERRGPTLRLVAGVDRDVRAVLEPVWEVRGRAVDEEGRGMGGVRIVGFGADGALGAASATAADGRFAWRGPVVSTLTLGLTLVGTARAHVEVVPPARLPLVSELGAILLRPRTTATLEGRVLLSGGRLAPPTVRVEPAAAAVLRELFGSSAVRVLSTVVPCDAQGAFLVPDVPAGIPLRVSIRGAGLPLDDLVDASSGLVELQAYTPPPGHDLEGEVVEEGTGRMVAGLELLVSERPVDGATRRPDDRVVVTDAAGRFRLTGLPRGDVHIRAYPEGKRALLRPVALPRVDRLRLVCRPPGGAPQHVVEGVVVDDHNEPLEGVTVRAAGRSVTTDEDGRFRLDDVEGVAEEVPVEALLAPGQRTAGLDPARFVPGVRRAVAPGDGPTKLVLSRAASLRFRAIDGIHDEPLASAHLLLRTEDGQVLVDRGVAFVDGVAHLDCLMPGGANLSLFTTRHRFVSSVILEPSETTDLGTLRLARGMHVTGRVVDADGEPVPGAFLSGVDGSGLELRRGDPSHVRELELRRTRTRADGSFELDGFDPKEPAGLAVWAPGFAPAARRVVLEKLQDDVHVDLTIRLLHGGWLDVELVESGGASTPISGALFDLKDARNGSDYLDLLRRGMLGGTVGSDDDWRRASEHFLVEKGEGRYRLGPIEPGPYEVLVHRPGYAALKRKLTVIDPAGALVGVAGGRTRSLIDSPYLTWELEVE